MSVGFTIRGQLTRYRNEGALRLDKSSGDIVQRASTHELAVSWRGGSARLHVDGDLPVLPLGVDVDDVTVVMIVELHYQDTVIELEQGTTDE